MRKQVVSLELCPPRASQRQREAKAWPKLGAEVLPTLEKQSMERVCIAPPAQTALPRHAHVYSRQV